MTRQELNSGPDNSGRGTCPQCARDNRELIHQANGDVSCRCCPDYWKSGIETVLSPSGDVIVPGDDWEDEWTVGQAIDFINAMRAEEKP